MTTPVLHLVAGPNGAGKSTFVARVLQPATHLPFVNADHIAAQRWPDDAAAHAYDAARLAEGERRRLMAEGLSFLAETVFSHPNKVALVEEAVARKYLVHLHVILVPGALAVARVADRVRRGGHDVPPEKVLARYERLCRLIAEASARADTAVFYDNAKAAKPFRVVASYERGRPVGEPTWPVWVSPALRR